ncbi:MAG: OmpA family protein, partial [Desulfobacteraceae bacterium]
VREDLEACLERESAHGEKIRNLERSLERVQETKQEKETSLVSRIEKLTEGEEELRGRIQAQEETVSSMERRVESAARGKEALEEELAEKKQVLQDLQEHLSSVRREKEELQRSLADVRSRFKALVADLEEQVRQKGVTIEKLRGELTVTVVDKILFDSGRAELRHEGREVLQRLADVLKEAKQRSIRVVGHTDNVPIGPFLRHKFPTNWELSAARAASVVRFLDRYLDPDRMEAVGCSFYDAVTSNETPEGRAKNRRVEIMIAPRLEPSGPPS